MKKILLCLVIFITGTAFSQNSNYSISGTIIDKESQETLPSATIQLYSLPDSTIKKGEISSLDGKFTIDNLQPGEYKISISFIGFTTKNKKVTISEAKANVNLGKISLDPDSKLLDEIKIVAATTPVSVKEDTLVYSASAFRVTDGAMLEDLVKKLPGAEISSDGKLLVNGKEIKKILVDGKEFFSDDPQISLKNLPANMVKDVKTYNKKSDAAQLTGVDDDDDETVLDLSVKKGMKKGWFGNAFGGGGYDINNTQSDVRYEAGANINRFNEDANLSLIASVNNTNNAGFSELSSESSNSQSNAGNGITSSGMIGSTFAKDKSDHFDFGGNVQYGHSKNDAEKTSSKESFYKSGSTYKNDTSTSFRKKDNLTMNFRFKWKPDTLTTIIFRPNISYNHNNSGSNSNSENLNSDLVRINKKTSHSESTGDNVTATGNLRVVRKLNEKGRNISLNASINYGYNQTDSKTNSNTNFFINEAEEMIDSLLVIDRTTNKNSNSLTYSAEAAYTEPIFTKHFLQLKYRFQQRKSHAKSLVYNDDEQNYTDSLSSEIENRYNTHRIEAGLQGKYSKMNYNIGFALQPQTSKSETSIGPNTGKTLEQTVLNYSPSLRFRYKFSKQHNLSFRYNGQSSAPNVEDLQDIIDESDPLDLQYGNPDLKPSYKNSIRLSYKNYDSKKQRSIATDVNFQNTVNAITNKTIYNTITGAKESYKVNINGNWNVNGYLVLSTPLKNPSFNVSSTTNSKYGNDVNYTDEESTITTIDSNGEKSITHSFTLGERIRSSYRNDNFDISLDLSGIYQNINNKLQEKSNRETFDYEIGGDVNFSLPWNMTVSSDINYHIYVGYTDGFDKNSVIWNAQLGKSFLKENAATIKIKIYDILQQRSNFERTTSESSITDTEYNTLGSYFMINFIYKFNKLPVGNKTDLENKENQKKERFDIKM